MTLAITLAITLAVTLIYRNLLHSPLGRAFAAVRDSEVSAQAMGIDIARTKTTAFGLSCAITGLGGAPSSSASCRSATCSSGWSRSTRRSSSPRR